MLYRNSEEAWRRFLLSARFSWEAPEQGQECFVAAGAVLLLAIINPGHGRGAGAWKVGEVMAVSRGWAVAKPINSRFRACPAASAGSQGFLVLLWPREQA